MHAAVGQISVHTVDLREVLGTAFRANIHLQFLVAAVIAVCKGKIDSFVVAQIHRTADQAFDRLYVVIDRITYILDLASVAQFPETAFQILFFDRCNIFGYMAVEAVADVWTVGYILHDAVFLAELLDLQTAQTLCRCTVDCIQISIFLLKLVYFIIDVFQNFQGKSTILCNGFSIVKLLQLIQEKTIERVSGTKRIELDFRLLVATNRNLEEEVQRGLFRSDLFYRLNVIRVHIPPLRQRPGDILPMAHQFLERFCKEYGKQLALSPRFVAFLEQYPWPGNVRQLENLMERLVITAQNPILDITALPLEYNSGGSTPDLPSQEGTLAERMDAFEGQIIRDSYRRCGTTVAVAKELGISQATAVRKIAKYVKDRKE